MRIIDRIFNSENRPFIIPETVNIGRRQNNRSNNKDIINTGYIIEDIVAGIEKALKMTLEPVHELGAGDSKNAFYSILLNGK